MRLVKWVLAVVGLLVVAGAVALVFWGGQLVREAVNRVGPQVLGVPVHLEQAHFRPWRGYISLTGLVVGNPEGFKTENLFQMDYLEIDLDMSSLLSDTLVINRILIDAPQITYEVGMRGTNLGALLANLEGEPVGDEEVPSDPLAPDEPPARTVVIKELILADARARVSATALGGQAVPVQLSTITLNDLGGEDQSLRQIVTEVLWAVTGAVTNAVAGAGDLLGDGVMSALEGVGALGGMAGDGVRAVTGAAGEGARTVGEGTRAVGDALSDGARGVRDLLGRRETQEAPGADPAEPETSD